VEDITSNFYRVAPKSVPLYRLKILSFGLWTIKVGKDSLCSSVMNLTLSSQTKKQTEVYVNDRN